MSRRAGWWWVGVLAVLVGLAGLYQLLLHRLEAALLAQLGPRASVGALSVDWTGLTVRDLRVAAAPGWPAAHELKAGRIFVQPDLRSLFSGPWRLHRIEVDEASLSLLRGRDGRLRLLPGLLDKPAPGPAHTARAASAALADKPGELLWIQEIALRGLTVDFYDDSLRPVRAKPHHLQIDQLNASVGNLHLPALAQPLALSMQGRVRGLEAGAAPQDGQLTLSGTLTPATHDAELQATLHGVDLRVLQPYLLKVADGGIQRGRLDLTLEAKVSAERLRAPGRVTLTGLTLAHTTGWWDQLGTASRQAVLDTLARKGQIDVSFTLEGRLDDPNFSLNDSLAKRFATGVAESVGVSVGGVVEGVGQLFKGLLGR